MLKYAIVLCFLKLRLPAVYLQLPSIVAQQHTLFILGSNTLLTYSTQTKLLNGFDINLNLRGNKMHIFNNKLYIIGGFTKNKFFKSPSSNVFYIHLRELKNTVIKRSKTI